MNTAIVNQLASILEADAQVIRSSNGRHIASGNVVGKSSASRVSLSDGESRPKPVRDAFTRSNAIALVLATLTPDVSADVEKEREVIRAAANGARNATVRDTAKPVLAS